MTVRGMPGVPLAIPDGEADAGGGVRPCPPPDGEDEQAARSAATEARTAGTRMVVCCRMSASRRWYGSPVLTVPRDAG
ncbi:hypothetical protein GCM10010402_65160 [Actinomadura luteofluorescens]